MARPIPLELPVRDPRVELQARLQDAPVEHAEAILAAFEVLQGLHDRGVLELLRGALGSSEKVLEIAIDAAKSPQSIRSIRNLILMVNLLGEVDPEQLGAITRAVPQALQSAARQPEPPGLWSLMKAVLGNVDIRRALAAFLTLLTSFGSSLRAPTQKAR